MTKIVKAMDKVTNHENMRRYVHMKLSKNGNGGSDGGENPGLMIIDGIEYDDYSNGEQYNFVPLNPQNTASKAIQHLLSGGAVFAHVTTIRDNEGNVDPDDNYIIPCNFYQDNPEQGYAAQIRLYSPNIISGMMWDDAFVIPEG